MKAIITIEGKENQPIKFPCLMQIKTYKGTQDRIVLFLDKVTAIPMTDDFFENADSKQFQVSEDWVLGCFVPFEGSVTIKNN